MPSRSSDISHLPRRVFTTVKVGVVGPFGVGKTTLVQAVSEIRPMTTDERMTQAGHLIDNLQGLQSKQTTTVSMDFGRCTLADDIVLYLFGAPGQPRFRPMALQAMFGALGGVALVDTRRLDESFEWIDLLEDAGLPYVAALNMFPGAPRHHPAELRDALSLDQGTPLVEIDARERRSAAQALTALVDHILTTPATKAATP